MGKPTKKSKADSNSLSTQFPPKTLVLAKRLSKDDHEGEWRDATVIENRPIHRHSHKPDNVEFYVHYLGFDRRFDRILGP